LDTSPYQKQEIEQTNKQTNKKKKFGHHPISKTRNQTNKQKMRQGHQGVSRYRPTTPTNKQTNRIRKVADASPQPKQTNKQTVTQNKIPEIRAESPKH
jgi:hypothetical protein